MRAATFAPAQHTQDYSSPMTFGDLQFRFRWIPTLLLALPVPIFVVLGIWQLDRAEQKAELAETLKSRAQQAPVSLQDLIGYADADAIRYRAAQARGSYDTQRQFYIEGRRQGSNSGFHVITPLRLTGSKALLLVNRGWVRAMPDGSPSEAPIPTEDLAIFGEAEVPSPPALVLHGDNDAALGWGDRWPYLTVDLFAATTDAAVQPVVLLLDPQDAHGFVRKWKHPMPSPAMHQGYAIQWFGFAVIALVLYLRLSFERRKTDSLAADA